KRTRTGSWPLLSYAPWVLQLLSEFAIVFYTLPDFDEGNRIFQANLSPLEAVKAEHGQMNIRLRTYSDGKIMVYENIRTFKE
ncbi:hypothetical protein, partial [Klebsiella michiganensis]|uniref:hypothetical protein n=1 Tax=Klebsiella michiganensis TaxID=1134687 RepID=UPI0026DEA1E2